MRLSFKEFPLWRLLRSVVNRTRTRWLLTAFVALIAVGWTVSAVSAAEDAASSWGIRRTVPIALVDLAPGRIITKSDITFEKRPIALLPTDIAESPVGKTVTRKIGANETIIETRLAGGSAFGPSALLEADAIAFAVPIDANTPTLKVGDKVELFAPSEVVTTASRGSGPAVNLTSRSTVVDVNEKAIMIGVSPAESGVVARALLAGAIIIALAN